MHKKRQADKHNFDMFSIRLYNSMIFTTQNGEECVHTYQQIAGACTASTKRFEKNNYGAYTYLKSRIRALPLVSSEKMLRVPMYGTAVARFNLLMP